MPEEYQAPSRPNQSASEYRAARAAKQEAQAAEPQKPISQREADWQAGQGSFNLGPGVTTHHTDAYNDSFAGYDINFNADDWEGQRAKNQSGWEQAGSAITQLVVGEVLGGTIENIGSLFNIQDWGGIAEGESQNTANFLQEIGRGLKEGTQENFAIYEEEPGSFNMSDSGWWFKNGVSMGSTLSMMLPAMGVMKGISMAGKALGGAKLLAKMGALGVELGIEGSLANTVVKGVGQAIVSRQLENTMEAQGVYDEQVKFFMSKGYTRDEAKKGAGIAAADVYKKNWAMLAMDIPQYMLLGSKFNPASLSIDTALSKAIGKSATASIAKGVRHTVVDLAGEGVEESFQYIVGEEAKYLSNRAMGIDHIIPETKLSERMEEYSKSGEMWSSAFWGAAGGGVFAAIGPMVQKGTDQQIAMDAINTANRAKDINTFASRAAMWGKRVRQADISGNPAVMEQVRIEMNADMTIARAQLGNIDKHIEQLKAQASMTEKEIEEFNSANEGKEITNDFRELIPKLIADAENIKEMYGKNARKYSQALVPAITTAEFNRERYTKQAEETRLEAKQEEAKIPGLSKLSDRGAILWESKLDLAANEHFIAMTEDLMNSEGLTKQARKSMAKAIAAAKEDIAINLEDIAAASEMEYTGTKKEIANRKRYDRNKLKAIGTADSTFKLIAKAALLEAQVEAAQEEYAFFTDKDFNEKNKNLHHKVAIENAENLEVLNDIKKKAGEAVDQEVKDAIEKKSKELAKQDKEEEDNEKEEDNKASLKKAENTIVEEEGKAARIKAENAKLKRMMLGEEVEEEELDVLKDLEVEEPKGPVNPEDVPGSKAAIKKAQVEKEAKEKSSKAAAIPVEVIEEREKDPVKDAVKTSKSVAKSGEVLVEDVTGITGKLGSKEDKTPSNTKGDNAYMNLAYNSTYKTGSSRRDKALSKFLENPETKLDGYSVEYKIGTEYLKLKQKFELFDDFTKGNQITDLIQQEMAQIPVEAHIIDSDGNPAKEDEVSLYMTVFDKSSDSKERANLLSIRQDLVAAHFEGTKLTSPITNKGDGAPRVDNTGTEHSLTTVLGEGEVVFMVPTRGLDNNMDKGFYSAGTGDNVPDISSVSMREGTKGFGFAVAKTAGARDYPFKMNAPKITPDNAEIAYNILKALMSSDKSITPTALIENETIAGFHNITYGNALNLIVFNGTKTAESGQFPIYIMEGNILKMGENIFIKPNEIGGEVAKAQVIEYLKGITTPIEHSRINKPLLEGTGKERAKLFGKEYTNTDSYNRFMIDTRRVTTNTKVDENGHSFHTPSITVGSPTVSGTPKVIKPAQTSFDTLGSPSQSEQLQMDLEQELAIAEERLNLTEIESPELFAINNAAGITPESFKEQNMSVGIKADVALGWVRTAKSGGITLDQAAHKLFEQANDRGIHEGVTESDFKDMLLDAVKGTKVLEREKITGSKKDITELRKELADVKAKNEASSYTAPKVTKVAKPTSFNKKYATSKKAAEKNGTEFKLITMDDIKLKESSLDGFDEQEGVVSVVLLEERTDGVTRSGTVKIQTVDGDISKYEVTLKSEPNSVEAQIDKIERRRKDFLDKYNRGEATNEIIEVDNYEWKKGKLYNVRLEISGYYGKGTFFEGVESEEAGYGLPRLYIKNTNELIDDSYTGNIERLINAKYDTEIAALEGKPAIAVAEPAKLSFKEKLAIAQAKKIEENNDVNESNFRRFDNSPGLDKGGVEFLEKNFPHIPVRLKERLLRIKGSSNKAYGAYKNGIITLSKVAAQGTAYHEAFHVVADLHMTPSEKKAIFKEAERKYGTMSSKKLEEELAEAARRYISSGGKTKHSGVMAQFFADLWNLIKDVFTNERRANKVFQGMMDGKYANAPVSARVSDMSNETMYREISAFSAATTKAFVNTLTFEIAHQTGALDAENLDLITKNDITEESIKGFLNGYVNETLEAAENAQTEEEGEALMALYEKYQEALNHTELFRDGVIDNFKSYGLKTTSNKKETIEDDESTEETVEDVEQGDGGLGIKPAFESSGKDNASGNTKMMLSMLPKLKSTKVTTNSNGKVIKDYIVDELTGRPMLASFDATWASTASKLADIVDTHNGATGVTELAFDKMMDALAELALTRPEISIIHKRLTSPETPINSKAQFFNAFSKHHIEFLTTRATKDEETGSWTSKTGTSATRTHASSILREWGALFNDKFLLEDGTTYNKEAIDGAISNYKTFQAVLVNDLRKDINVVKNQERFRKMLHSIGVNISESGLNTYILSQKGEALGDKLWSAYTSLDHAFSTGMAKATEVNNIKHILESEERFKDLSKAE